MGRLIAQLYYAADSYKSEIIPTHLEVELSAALKEFDEGLDPERVFNKAAALFAGICRGADLDLLFPVDMGTMNFFLRPNIHIMVTYVLLRVYDTPTPSIKKAIEIYEKNARNDTLKLFLDNFLKDYIGKYGQRTELPRFVSTTPSELSMNPNEWRDVTHNFQREYTEAIVKLYPDDQQHELAARIAQVGMVKATGRWWITRTERRFLRHLFAFQRRMPKFSKRTGSDVGLFHMVKQQERTISNLKRQLQEDVIRISDIKERLLELESHVALQYITVLNTIFVNYPQWTTVSHEIEMEIRQKGKEEKAALYYIQENHGVISDNITIPQLLKQLNPCTSKSNITTASSPRTSPFTSALPQAECNSPSPPSSTVSSRRAAVPCHLQK